jgi:FtsH-binding integral membrane protein
MADGPGSIGALGRAWGEARLRVLGGGFDRSFRMVLLAAYLAGALFLAHRSGEIAPSTILTGLVAMALFLAMPLVTIFTYVLGLSFLAGRAGLSEQADPPMRVVFAAFAVALVTGACFVGAAFWLPLVGAQLRLIFS